MPYPNSFFVNPNLSLTNSSVEVGKIIEGIFDPKNCLNSYRSIGVEKVISVCAFMRGDMLGIKEIEGLKTHKNRLNFYHWSPTGLKMNISPIKLKKAS